MIKNDKIGRDGKTGKSPLPRFTGGDAGKKPKVITREDLMKRKTIHVVERPAGKKSFFKPKAASARGTTAAKVKKVRGHMEIAVANLSADLNVMINAAHKAGRGLLRFMDELTELKIMQKKDKSLYSAADTDSEAAIVECLNKARPTFSFLSEEGGELEKENSESGKKFIIDPLDGTSNFLHGIPFFAVSIAMQVNNEVTAGVIYNPVSDETFYAEKGGGAYLLSGGNNKRIRVAERSRFIDCIITTGIPNAKTPGHKEYAAKLSRVMAEVDGIRRTGSAALDLAYVASGRFDGYFESGVKAWDIAAGILLVREAGGYVCDYDGNEKDSDLLKGNGIVASSEAIKKNFKKLLFAK